MDRYKQIKILGKGSFGSAWLIQRVSDKEQFVAKEVRLAGLKPQERESAKHEIDMLRTLDHPNITRYVDHFEHHGSLFIVMEYANGGDLYMKIKSRAGRRFSEKEVLQFFSQLCLALSYLHDRRILHRDLKSQNVFLTKDGVVKLGDFGISTVLRNTYELKRTVCGTPYYFSPELCLNKPYNNKSDVWALGCILYELTTLNHAFDGNNMKALVQKILKGVYPPIGDSYTTNLAKLISTMLQLDPKRRPNVSQIIDLPFIRESLSSLQEKVQVAQEQRCSVVSAEEKYKMKVEAARLQEEYHKKEREKAAAAAERQKQRALEQRRVLQEQQQRDAERRKEIEARVRDQRRERERWEKDAAAKNRQREEQWERNRREDDEAQRQRRDVEGERRPSPQQQRGGGGGASPGSPGSPGAAPAKSAAELYQELRRQAAMNKQRVEQAELGHAPQAEARRSPRRPGHGGGAADDDDGPPRGMSKAEMEEARRAAFWQMRREAEMNKRRLLGNDVGDGDGGGLPPIGGSPAAPPPVVAERRASPASRASPARRQPEPPREEEVPVDVSPSEAGSPTVEPDGDAGLHMFLNGEAVAGEDGGHDEQKRANDYGALSSAIGAALLSVVRGDREDFDDEVHAENDPTKFILDGQTLHLPEVRERDPIMHRIEFLRMFLEHKMGDDTLMACYRAMNNISATDEGMQRVADDLPPSQQRFIPLVAQLIVCEDVFNQQGRG